MTALLIAEHTHGVLCPSTAKALSAAKAIGGDIDVLVAGSDIQNVAKSAAGLMGIRKVLVADAAHLARHLAEEMTALVLPLMQQDYTVLIAPATTTMKNFMPRVAALLDIAQISDIIAVEAPNRFKRPIYAGNAIQVVETNLESKQVITVRTTAFDAEGEGEAVSIEAINVPEVVGLSAFESEEHTDTSRPELTSARVVVSGGRGMQSAENFQLLEKIADKLGGAVGATRAAVDAGFIANDYQIGQTGKIVAPDLYIAVGISGAIQHLAGIKDSKIIVAINKEEAEPIFQIADYGLVEDLFQALPELEAELTKMGL
jgi:electron transfer flavoprotein alpha subunit